MTEQKRTPEEIAKSLTPHGELIPPLEVHRNAIEQAIIAERADRDHHIHEQLRYMRVSEEQFNRANKLEIERDQLRAECLRMVAALKEIKQCAPFYIDGRKGHEETICDEALAACPLASQFLKEKK